MNNIVDFLVSREVILVYLLAGISFGVALIFYFIEKTNLKRQQKYNTKQLNLLVESITEKEEPVTIVKEQKEEVIRQVVNSKKEQIIPISKPVEKKVSLEPIIIEEKTPEETIEIIQEEAISSLIINEPDITNMVEVTILEPEKKTEEVITKIEYPEENIIEEIIEYAAVEPDKTTAQAELEKLTEELRQKEENKVNIELTEFELKQEENAIISLDELAQRANTFYEENEITQYTDEGNELISIQELEARMSKIKEDSLLLEITPDVMSIEPEIEIIGEPIIKHINTTVNIEEEKPNKIILDDFNTIDKEEIQEHKSTFKRSPIISPIYGIEQNINSDTSLELENTANYAKLDEEIRKTNEFLMTLKELQKELD